MVKLLEEQMNACVAEYRSSITQKYGKVMDQMSITEGALSEKVEF